MTKIYYLIPGPMGAGFEAEAELTRRGNLLRQYASPGTEIGIGDTPEGPASIESMYEEYLAIPSLVRRAVELEKEGWEAIILGCYGDPGLDAARELLSIPVVGPGEATALVAASLGHRFSVLTITRSAVAGLVRMVRNAGVGEKLASVRAIEIPVLQLHHDRERTIAATLAEGEKAVSQDGADTLILGCMSMGFLEIAEAIAPALGVPVLNPGKVALKWAEGMVGAGLAHSRLAYLPPPKLVSGEARSIEQLFHVHR
jgi:allantoin racemase